MRLTSVLGILFLAAACGDGTGSSTGATAMVERDSAGVTIREYPEGALENAPVWNLSSEPLAVIGDDSPEATLDLSTASLGGILSDGRVVVATAQPAQMMMFGVDGSQVGTLGRQGEGPGEYRFLQQVLVLPGDTIVAFELVRRKGIHFAADGTLLQETDFPLPADRQIPPLMRGRLVDGTYILSGEQMIPQAPEGQDGVFRVDLPIFAMKDDSAATYDTVTVTRSSEQYGSSLDVMGNTMPIARPLAFGATPLIATTSTAVWVSTGDVPELRAYPGGDSMASVVPSRIVRFAMPTRPVTEEDRERYKTEAKAALQQFASMMPPDMLASEIAKVDETRFATNFPALGQIRVDAAERIWISTGAPFGDSLRTWAVLDSSGTLLGRVTLPDGQLFAAAADRVVVRREDGTTGLVRLEVWGITAPAQP